MSILILERIELLCMCKIIMLLISILWGRTHTTFINSNSNNNNNNNNNKHNNKYF